MKDNIIIKENPMEIFKKEERRKIEPKVEEILIRQMEQSKIKKPFEKMTSLLGITAS